MLCFLFVSVMYTEFAQLVSQNVTPAMSVETDWGLYTSTDLWNICKSVVCKTLYKVLSILQVVIFCRLQIINILILY